jgi:hypothetical protein
VVRDLGPEIDTELSVVSYQEAKAIGCVPLPITDHRLPITDGLLLNFRNPNVFGNFRCKGKMFLVNS